MGKRITGRTVHPEISDATGWPALPSSSSSTPIQSRTQPWTTAKGKTNSKYPVEHTVKMQISFAPLHQDSASPSDELEYLSLPQRMVRSVHKSEANRPQAKLTRGPQILIVRDAAVKDMRFMFS
ncbi:uncharacterized protein LOC117821914 [Xyrichtys novacula]|uniref:Uncharacterized protein LOC117821914 n=1 Tax=Xyrichtys novacula TaxID=13765 RepID=A0AAV1G1R7_XYRNO|nr:uncharacterized protein LOC117821914 [Xyrichtys novacula]